MLWVTQPVCTDCRASSHTKPTGTHLLFIFIYTYLKVTVSNSKFNPVCSFSSKCFFSILEIFFSLNMRLFFKSALCWCLFLFLFFRSGGPPNRKWLLLLFLGSNALWGHRFGWIFQAALARIFPYHLRPVSTGFLALSSFWAVPSEWGTCLVSMHLWGQQLIWITGQFS